MSDVVEVAITSDASAQLWSACVWDPRAGTSLMTYRGGGVAHPHCLGLLGSDFLLSADNLKPVLHAWCLGSHEPEGQGLKLVCPGRVSALTSSPDGLYIVAGVAERIHIWQIASGRLLSVVARHFQHVTRLAFTDDGSLFVSAGEDGLVLVWPLGCLVSSQQQEPRYVFSDHSLPVRDLVVGKGGVRARLYTASSDRTSKVYCLSSGELLLSLVLDVALTAVAVDPLETSLFLGGADGGIRQCSLLEVARTKEHHTDPEQTRTLRKHTRAVTALAISQDGLLLLSGSVDETVAVWHVPSGQCTRVLPHKGPVTNAMFCLAPRAMLSGEGKPGLVLHSLQRGLNQDDASCVVEVLTQEEAYPWQTALPINATRPADPVVDGFADQIAELKRINLQLYRFAAEKVLALSLEDVDQSATEPVVSRVDFSLPVLTTRKKKKKSEKKKSLKKKPVNVKQKQINGRKKKVNGKKTKK